MSAQLITRHTNDVSEKKPTLIHDLQSVSGHDFWPMQDFYLGNIPSKKSPRPGGRGRSGEMLCSPSGRRTARGFYCCKTFLPIFRSEVVACREAHRARIGVVERAVVQRAHRGRRRRITEVVRRFRLLVEHIQHVDLEGEVLVQPARGVSRVEVDDVRPRRVAMRTAGRELVTR